MFQCFAVLFIGLLSFTTLSAQRFQCVPKLQMLDRTLNRIELDLTVSNDSSLKAMDFRVAFTYIDCQGFKISSDEIIVTTLFRAGRFTSDSNFFSYSFDTVVSGQKKLAPRTLIKVFIQPKMKLLRQGSMFVEFSDFCASGEASHKLFVINKFDQRKSVLIYFDGTTPESIAKNLEELRAKTRSASNLGSGSDMTEPDSFTVKLKIKHLSVSRDLSSGLGKAVMSLDISNGFLDQKLSELYLQVVVPDAFTLDSVVNVFDNKIGLVSDITKSDSAKTYQVGLGAANKWFLARDMQATTCARLYFSFRGYQQNPVKIDLKNIYAYNRPGHWVNETKALSFETELKNP